MLNLNHEICESGSRIAVAGHVHPDGDCIGSCTGLFLYIKALCPDREVTLFLEQPTDSLLGITGGVPFLTEVPADYVPDALFLCDVSSADRIGVARTLLDQAAHTVCIDHHVSNPGIARINHIEPDASSCAEVLANLMDADRIDTAIASALYAGIIHDSGIFCYRNTSPRTLRTAALLVEKGVPFTDIIEKSFKAETYAQTRILGHALEKSRLMDNGLVVASSVSMAEMETYGVTKADLDAIVAQLRLVTGCEAAVFAYEVDPDVWKFSLRSNHYLDVAACAVQFGGGGHVRAAGLTLSGTLTEVMDRVLAAVEASLAEDK